MEQFDVTILGGGAAGLMCAIVAGQRGRRVLVLEGSNKVGKKILMSGGGRCNFTNLNSRPGNFLSANPHFCKSALSRYTPYDFLAMVDAHGIPWHEKTAGQLFCDRSSKDIVAMLLAECDDAGVTVLTQSDIKSVADGDLYRVDCAHGRFLSDSLVVATGGLSIPKMGASDFGYRIARKYGLQVLPTRAGLVPFTFTGAMHELTGRLSGVSTRAEVRTERTSFGDDILFTHRGLSGPAALQLSSYWQPGSDIIIDLLSPNVDSTDFRHLKGARPRATLRSLLGDYLPRALVVELQSLFWPDVADTGIGEISNDRLQQIATALQRWAVRPSGTEGYRTAEVTLGGVDTATLSSQTMECRHQRGLYFIGEVVDVTGHLGGHNFQWAWASAHAAGSVA
ncbi:MAG: NAD(P)/FAD-dependent oxidoreductase [Woeseiaceae bacterium]|nr:NAD(P)/FAD-dependent oxidoreductase [Woeseiaceae bacterium]